MFRFLVLGVPLFFFVFFSVIFFVRLGTDDLTLLPSALIDRPVPEFELPPLPGLTHNNDVVLGLSNEDLSSDLSDDIFLVNIFASWCVPCRAEHPVLMDLSSSGRIRVVGINYKDDLGNALRFLGELGNPYERVGVDTRGSASIEWGVYGVPETFLVDSSGIIRHKVIGPITATSYDELDSMIDRLSNP